MKSKRKQKEKKRKNRNIRKNGISSRRCRFFQTNINLYICLLYTSDAADE